MTDAAPAVSSAPSGAAHRARLAAAARAAGGGRGGQLVGPGPRFAALCAPPPWLLLPHAEQLALAERAALSDAAPGLARCLDGRVLGPLADAFGDEALDEALRAATPDQTATPTTLSAIRANGAALLADAVRGAPRAAARLGAAYEARGAA